MSHWKTEYLSKIKGIRSFVIPSFCAISLRVSTFNSSKKNYPSAYKTKPLFILKFLVSIIKMLLNI